METKIATVCNLFSRRSSTLSGKRPHESNNLPNIATFSFTGNSRPRTGKGAKWGKQCQRKITS